ncbi:hypothetical protein BpHYR1_043885, partial [Brachionus plicatilis]
MKQESKNNESRCSVQPSSGANQQAVNANSTITQVQRSNQVAVQQNLVNWKWVVVDPVRFKDYPIPCIIRHNDSVKEYVSVRIIEKVILSKFEANLSEEAKNFGVLTTFFCTTDEIFTLNDINENHVDRFNQSNPSNFVNYIPNMINNLQATKINPIQHKIVQIIGAAPGQALPIIQATPTSLNQMTNLRNQNQNLINCLNSNQIQTNLQQKNPSLSLKDASFRNHPL